MFVTRYTWGMGGRDERAPRIVIIGAGPGGLCMGIQLQEAGFPDFVILERGDGVGGTWRRNTYPGAACDVPSALYSFSFAPKADWSRPYAGQAEILQYLEELADHHGLLPRCRFDCQVLRSTWQAGRSEWEIELAGGEIVVADIVVSAVGMFNELSKPEFDGLDQFSGTMFHSANWRWDHDLAGERVAVIGSAASAVQFVPEIVKHAGMVHLYQRTANWVLPKLDTPYSDEQLAQFRADPSPILAQRRELFTSMDEGMLFQDAKVLAEREAIVLGLLGVVEDPDVRERLRPTHPWGCKRPLFSNEFYPSFNRPNLELVTDPIERITADSVITVDGTERSVDTLILATGFSATRFASVIDVVGSGSRHLDEVWSDGAIAYLGVTTAGFPNWFMLYGPNTNNGSILTMIEYQVAHVLAHLRRMAAEGLAWVDVRPEPMARYNDEVQRGMAAVPVWNAGCNGYYRSPSGRVVTQWPFTMSEFRRRTEVIDPSDYDVGLLRAAAG